MRLVLYYLQNKKCTRLPCSNASSVVDLVVEKVVEFVVANHPISYNF